MTFGETIIALLLLGILLAGLLAAWQAKRAADELWHLRRDAIRGWEQADAGWRGRVESMGR